MQTQRNDMKIEKSVSIHLHALNDHAIQNDTNRTTHYI